MIHLALRSKTSEKNELIIKNGKTFNKLYLPPN